MQRSGWSFTQEPSKPAGRGGWMSAVELKIDARDWGLLVLLSVMWGGSFFFVGSAIREFPPLTIVFLRVSLAAVVLLPLLWIYRIRFPSSVAGWKPFAVMAVIGSALPFSLLATSQQFIPSGMASVLNATTPLFTVLVMAAFGAERLTLRRLSGVILGFAGVAILRGQGADITSTETVGILLCLAASFSFGLSALWAKRHLAGVPPVATATFQLIVAGLMMAVLAVIVETPWRLPMPSALAWVAVLSLAVVSTALGFIIFFQVMVRSGPSNVMLVTLLVPVTAILLGHFVLGEVIERREYVGAAVIGAALLIMDGRILGAFTRQTRL